MFLELLRENGVEDADIGVVAPYLGQRDLLQEYTFLSFNSQILNQHVSKTWPISSFKT